MRIKEVEKATGLTAKAIRMYEAKGLLCVARQSENDYRDYSEEDVKRLQTIAVLRRLDIPVKEIKTWCDGETELRDLIAEASYQAHMAQEQEKAKTELTAELLKILEEDPDADIVTVLDEVKTLQALYSQLDELTDEIKGSLLGPLYCSLIALGPIGWTFIRIITGETDKAIWSLVISLVIIPFVCFRWFQYFHMDRQKRNAKGCLSALVFLVFGVILAIGSVILVMVCQKVIFSPEDGVYLFRHPWVFVALMFPLVELFFVLNIASGKEKRDDENLGVRGWAFIVGLNLLMVYCCVTGVSFYADGAFTRHTLFDPMGRTYPISEVVRVETGFRGGLSSFLPWYQAGDFYYEVIFCDGTKENWMELNVVDEDDEEDPWLLILRLDEELMAAGVEKVTDTEYREKFPYDASCLEIADQILNER